MDEETKLQRDKVNHQNHRGYQVDGVIIQTRLSNSKTRAPSDSWCFILIIKVILPFDYSLCNCNYFCRKKSTPSFLFLFENFYVLSFNFFSFFFSPRRQQSRKSSVFEVKQAWVWIPLLTQAKWPQTCYLTFLSQSFWQAK